MIGENRVYRIFDHLKAVRSIGDGTVEADPVAERTRSPKPRRMLGWVTMTRLRHCPVRLGSTEKPITLHRLSNSYRSAQLRDR